MIRFADFSCDNFIFDHKKIINLKNILLDENIEDTICYKIINLMSIEEIEKMFDDVKVNQNIISRLSHYKNEGYEIDILTRNCELFININSGIKSNNFYKKYKNYFERAGQYIIINQKTAYDQLSNFYQYGNKRYRSDKSKISNLLLEYKLKHDYNFQLFIMENLVDDKLSILCSLVSEGIIDDINCPVIKYLKLYSSKSVKNLLDDECYVRFINYTFITDNPRLWSNLGFNVYTCIDDFEK